ncbi:MULTISPECIES: amylo-alpha-1,6-glucosidase [unclassified Tolypothrix]|uniref:amylo-alpha-1,6-glucosidase n=1 Tax=unclassified Tolypothrix TaxID=2649714 RepID=UPI0005EABDF8|nr:MULTISPECIES: amylo-alpha-1,6-glucosidase [unclassified Tolypothrix]BAY93388.1 amylo-alpha-1,6-glucosidase [Microchaete diplosiphon NIES-3275]EKE99392.1 amylo-alpha-1,6-glucosidase [Tolypothrix sp. PCC 7601]MBE9082903.1 amylo-alpha-1,6-glucosidase [Tolypothrix sp. LEGE 11397]UYD27239.1 amylo-alpha-1,6-glucosidase [Tolypothrix sp. PCC 7712]UYD36902.1 amylo-alpha-1,6-glucosidase [Tolypothrix sp. PCC 7601]
MTSDILMTPEKIFLDGKTYIPAEQLPIPEWPCVISERPQPTLTVKDDDLFFITDTIGNISGCSLNDGNPSMGLFCCDTRFLSRLELQIEGRSPVLLSSTADKGFALSVLCTNPRIDERLKADTVGIRRELVLNGALFEEIEVSNYSTTTVSFELSISFDADFVDLFEVRGYGRDQRGRLLRLVEPTPEDGTAADGGSPLQNHSAMVRDESLTLAYQGLDGLVMESRINFQHRQPDYFKGYTAVWQLELASHETQKLGYRVNMLRNNQSSSTVSAAVTLAQAKAAELMEEQHWVQQITRISTDKSTFNRVVERAEQDMYLLRQSFGKNKTVSAGVPWFSALFGRDSIITASQTLMLNPRIAKETLTLLATYQGKVDDEWREEEPGKILHELRLGEMARCQEIPHTPYYGTVDATPLWLMLYAEYYAWTHDQETLEQLWPNALAAMEWIDRNTKETSYLSYYRKSKRGLANQGWKDSGDCIVDHKGELANGPIALCEVQAYVYAAKMRLAEIARMKKRLDLADRWLEEARNLKLRFNHDFWMEDQDFCALALDGDGKQVDSITSNPGHCLHLGIFTPEKAYSVAERLRAPDMFNGWGIRTLSSLSPAYNPMGYHVGSVWPHDNAIIAMGLRSLGLIDQALELFQGLVDMTTQQPYQRPPELFCGYERNGDNAPVQYPVACTPQAWATGSIFQLLQMIVNLVPDAQNNCLRIIDPALPESINRLSLHNLHVGPTVLDLEFERSGSTTACRVAKKRGNLRVVIEA